MSDGMRILIDREAVDRRLDHGRLWGHGWGNPGDPTAPTCLHGAIRYCTPLPGDAQIIEQVGARFGFGTADNDAADSWEVLFGRVPAEITDVMLEAAFGSQWEHVVVLVRRAAVFTASETADLADARDAAGAARAAAGDAAGAARRAAWAAARAAGAAAWDAARAAGAAAWDAARAARDAAGDAAWDARAALDAAGAAAGAVAVRDLIGQHGFTQTHYDILTGPWREVIGPVHPDDADPS